jgi:phage terminase large subunit-like protein
MSQTLTLQIQYKPHPGQQLFHEDQSRFRTLACGRRWGKTKSGANETLKQTVQSPNEAVTFCVAPTFWHTQKQWREVLFYCPKQIIKDIHRGEHRIILLGNRYLWFKSADNPDSLRSEGLDFLWVDEGGQIKEEAWNLALRPALMDKKGRAIFTGTPKGKNWYYRLYSRGQDPLQTDYKSWNYPSVNNP